MTSAPSTPGPSASAWTVLFDVDGTLTDTNYLHVDAWAEAFEEAGIPADAWRIHRAIGMDSGLLLESIAPDASDERRSIAKRLHSERYRAHWSRVRAFANSRELVRELAARGARVVLTTSAPADEFEVLRSCLDIDDALHASTTSDDVDTAKPEPDIIGVALGKSGVGPDRAVFVGDSVWDMQAAGRAGVPAIALLSGGIGEDELRRAGASEIYEDPTELLERLDESALIARFSSR